jgi:catechol 2,3-dioxygenase
MHVAKNRLPITGASDHGVSEAFYLDDPEGNGVEVYNDRPHESWSRDGASILQRTDPLDVEAILTEIDPATAAYASAPDGLRIGHVHLRVGNVPKAEEFYCGAMGLDITRRRNGATFMSTGGYHHHIATNVWHSNGAGPRNDKRAGLAWVGIEAADDATLKVLSNRFENAGVPVSAFPGGIAAADPWGTRVRFTTAA